MSTKTNISKRTEIGTRIPRECRVDNCRKQVQTNTRVADPQPRRPDVKARTTSLKKTVGAATSESSTKAKLNVCRTARPNTNNVDRNAKTWFEVLLKSPEKCRSEKILRTSRQDSSVPCRCEKVLANDLETAKENFAPRSENSRRLNLLFDVLGDIIGDTSDQDFLNILNVVRSLSCNPSQLHSEHRNPFRVHQLTDDDKYKFQKAPKAEAKSSSSSDLVLLRALLKETKVQKEMLQSLTVHMSQLREENKMLSQLKDARLTLEAKLISSDTEIRHLKKENEKSKRLLELRDKEIEDLRKLVSVLKTTSANEFADHSAGVIATPPSCSICFDMPIRPASSSPAEEIQRKRNPIQLKNNSVSKTIHFEKNESRSEERKDADSEAMLQEVKNNVDKFLEVIESDMANLNTNDISLNLSDVTYKWSL